HSHLLDSNFYGALAARIGRRCHVATEHGDVHHVDTKKLLSVKLRTLVWCGSRIAAVSDFSANELSRHGVPRSRIHVVGNPIMHSKPPADTRANYRAKLDVPDSPSATFLWAHVANLRPVKDQETLLRGFATAQSLAAVPLSLLIIGDGD